MADQTKPTLFVGWFCPFAQRTWIAFEYLKLSYHLVNNEASVVLDKDKKYMVKGKPLVDATPAGQNSAVPTVNWGSLDGKKPTTGSIDLILACEEEGNPFFLGKETLQDWSNTLCSADFYGSVKPEIHEACFARLVPHLARFADALVGPFFMGEHFGCVDALVLPFLYRAFCLKIFEHHRGHSVHNAPWSSKLEAWVQRCLQIEAVQKTLPPDTDLKTGYSQELFKVYDIYAAGIGLKGITREAFEELQAQENK